MPPFVSIGMPVYNGEAHLEEAIDSNLSQTLCRFELIISDNASTDSTAEICRKYTARDTRIRYIRQPVNIGAPANYNEVFRRSSGDYFRWASSNDLVEPTLLEQCVPLLEDHADAVVSFPQTQYIDEQGSCVGEIQRSPELPHDRPSDRVIHLIHRLDANNIHGGVFRADALRRTGLERLHPGGDLILLVELAILGKFLEVPEPLYLRRMTRETATVHRSLEQIRKLYYPDEASKALWIQWPLHAGYLRAALRMPMPIRDRVRLTGFFMKMFYWGRGALWDELWRNLETG